MFLPVPKLTSYTKGIRRNTTNKKREATTVLEGMKVES